MAPAGGAPSRGREGLLTAAAAVLLVGSILLALARVTHLGTLGDLRLSASAAAMDDFQSTVYFPARAFADGANPYHAEAYLKRYPAPEPVRLYPPAMLLVSQPFSALPLGVAMWVQAVLSFVLSGVLAYVSLRLARLPATPAAVMLVWAVILISRPGQWNLLQGQATLWMVLGTYAAFTARRDGSALAALGLTLVMLKPNFGLPVAVLMLARGHIRAVVLGGVTTVVLNLAAMLPLIERAGGLGPFLSHFFSGTARLREAASRGSEFTVFRIDAGGLAAQFFGGHLPLAPSLLLTFGIVGAVAVVVRRRLEVDRARPDMTTAGLLCCTVLVSIYHIGYDLLLLTWPAVAVMHLVWTSPGRAPVWCWAQATLLGILALNYASTFSVIQALQAEGPLLTLLLSLNGAALLGLFGLYLLAASPGRSRLPAGALIQLDPRHGVPQAQAGE